MIEENQVQAGLAWQIGVWNEISDIYLSEIDRRFVPVVEATVTRAGLTTVVAVDISPEMLSLARQRVTRLGLANIAVREGRAESISAEDDTFDVVLASLSMMYVVEREAAAREIGRILQPGGRFVASVWAGPEECDIVLFQQTAGRFAGPPPVPGVGPGSLADASSFLRQLEAVGIQARVETQELGFDFEDFAAAWEALAGVTTAHLSVEQQQEAKEAVLAAVYPDGDGPRHFRNMTQFIIGEAVG